MRKENLLPAKWFRGALAAAALACAAASSAAGSFTIFSGGSSPTADTGREPGFRLRASLLPPPAPDLRAALAMPPAPDPPAPPTAPRPMKGRATLLTAGILAGATASTLSGGLDRGYVPFHFDQENWFGKNTYAGGADKASHFVLYNALSRELHVAYSRMYYPDDRAYLMAFTTSMAAGLITELGDAIGIGTGFGYEDLIVDALGAAAAVFMTRHGLDDVAGFRFGLIPAPLPSPCCPIDNVGKDYSGEIYTGDLKLAGVARRLRADPGPARFLLLSVTYGTKGYKYSPPEFRQQQIGIEVGLNFPEVLRAVGVRDTTWWGRGLYILFNLVRVPYTQIGYRYDFVHDAWHGPNIGEEYDPGP